MISLQHLVPIIHAAVFVTTVYLEKYIRKKLKCPKSWKTCTRIVAMVIITIILMSNTYKEQCLPYQINVLDCFYLDFMISDCLLVLLANTILFAQDIREKQGKYSYNNWCKRILFAPLLQQMLFRGNFYRINHNYFYSWYLALIFALCKNLVIKGHFHKYVWKTINGKNSHLQSSLSQFGFTFIYGCYSFYYLVKLESIVPTILLHSYCNFLGPPVINSKNARYHVVSILGFLLFNYFVF